MFNLQDAFYRPLWIRVAIVTVCTGWALFELWNGETIWAMLFGAIGVYSFYQFFIVWSDPPPAEPKAPGEDPEE